MSTRSVPPIICSFFGSTIDIRDFGNVLQSEHFSIDEYDEEYGTYFNEERYFLENFGDFDHDKKLLFEQGKNDLEFFSLHFFPHLCKKSFSAMHKEFFTAYNANIGRRGILNATAAPRANAKTTIITTIASIHGILYKYEKYILILQAKFDLAKDIVKSIREELESNKEIIRVFGPQVTDFWNMDDIITQFRCRVRAASPDTKLRGLLWDGNRVTKICLDDIESDKTTQTEEQREKLEKKYTQVIRQLGTLGHTNIEFVGTILHDNSLLSKLLRNPGYNRRFYKSVIKFCDEESIPYWQNWRGIYINLYDDNAKENAREYFEQNKEIMLKGAEVLWPEEESYYNLMCLRVIDGEIAFQQEKQNIPARDNNLVFDMDNAGYFSVDNFLLKRNDGIDVHFMDLTSFVAYLDPALGETKDRPDYSTLLIGAKDQRGYKYVLDCYMTNKDNMDTQIIYMANMLFKWGITKMYFEGNGFQSQIKPAIMQAISRKALEEKTTWGVTVLPIINTRSKIRRILSLQPHVANRWIYFNQDLPEEFFRQIEVFIPTPDADKDDGPDALEGLTSAMETEVMI